MALDPSGGKYADECKRVLAETGGVCAVVVVVGGPKGSGFSIASTMPTSTFALSVPEVLEGVAAEIRKAAN